ATPPSNGGSGPRTGRIRGLSHRSARVGGVDVGGLEPDAGSAEPADLGEPRAQCAGAQAGAVRRGVAGEHVEGPGAVDRRGGGPGTLLQLGRPRVTLFTPLPWMPVREGH